MQSQAVQTSCATLSPSSLSLKGQQWAFRTPVDHWAQKLSQSFSLSPFIAQILAMRAQTIEEAEAFLFPSLKSHLPDPVCLPDLEPALSCLIHAIQEKSSIAIWGDYDVDGATSSALWVRFLRTLGVSPQIYIPDRFTEGYGPNRAGLEKLADQGVKLVIMVDCGTTAFEPLERAQSRGLQIIVVDHHMPESTLPACTALINPKRLDAVKEAEPFQLLAAVALSFFVIMALNRSLRDKGFYTNDFPEPSLLSFLDLVALGTVCDVMPLKGINRILVTKGLQVMSRRQNLGLKTLMDVAGLREPATAYHLGFVLGPRINAGGRIGAATLGTQLLTTQDPAQALSIALQLDTLNQERQNIEKELEQQAIRQAESQAHDPCLVVSGDGWHQGVIGIVASRLKDRFYKPTFVISWEGEGDEAVGKGSARSIRGVDLGSLIHEARLKAHLLGGGGHAMAGGLSLQRNQLSALRTFLHERVRHVFPEPPSPTLHLIAPLTFQALNETLLEQLQALAPFGHENPTAVWVFHDLRLHKIFPIGAHHLRLELMQQDSLTYSAVAFRAVGTPLGDFLLGTPIRPFSVAATLQKNSYNGQIQLIVEDIMI